MLMICHIGFKFHSPPQLFFLFLEKRALQVRLQTCLFIYLPYPEVTLVLNLMYVILPTCFYSFTHIFVYHTHTYLYLVCFKNLGEWYPFALSFISSNDGISLWGHKSCQLIHLKWYMYHTPSCYSLSIFHSVKKNFISNAAMNIAVQVSMVI